nr:cell division protein FtsK [Ardenticatenales bacterium]
VYTVVLTDPSKPLPHRFSLADLERVSTVVSWEEKRFVWQDEAFKTCLLDLDGPPEAKRFNEIVHKVGAAAIAASKVDVSFTRIAPPVGQWWTDDSRGLLRTVLGPSGARKMQNLVLGKDDTVQHVLVAGKTGSGKSTLFHTIIIGLALSYSPDEVELYLVDFKKGVEFKNYASHLLPHARVVAIESEREFGLSVLQGLDAELTRRGEAYRGAQVQKLADYREQTGQRLPRILLLVDEFQEFFTEDDHIASQSSQILDRLVKQGRAFGIHVLLGSQTLAGAYSLARSTIDQMGVRIALQCSETDSRLILADDNPAARLLSRPGEAIYNAENGRIEGNNRFQVARLTDDERDSYLKRVLGLAEARGYTRVPVIFEGNAAAEVEKNHLLAEQLAAPMATTLPRAPLAWLGEPVALRDPVAARFSRQSGNNLLIIGQNEEATLGMLGIALISLASQIPMSDETTFYILDFGAADAPFAPFLADLAALLPHPHQYGRRHHLPTIINELAQEVQRRLEADESGAPPKYLFLCGLQRARDLRQEESFGPSYSYSDEPVPPSPAQQFTTILREGPDVGIHVLLSCDTVTNLNRTLERRALRELAMRVVFQMGAEDSAAMVDTPAASKLGPHRAFFYHEEEGRLEKFRPYSLPKAEWLKGVGEQL